MSGHNNRSGNRVSFKDVCPLDMASRELFRDSAAQSANRDTIRPDCRYFLGDRPCVYHKTLGARCWEWASYSHAETRILLIKLGAMGDVLRATSILPALSQHYEEPHITWVTRKESMDLLLNNPWIDSLVEYGVDSAARLQVETFDLVINPEASKESAALASIARGKEKRGLGLSPAGYVFPFNPEAEEIFKMGLLDDLKKRNGKSYEQLVCGLSGLTYRRTPPVLRITDGERSDAEKFRDENRIDRKRPVVGINTGGGTRWLLKRWTAEGFTGVIQRLTRETDAQILLMGGPTEVDFNRQVSSRCDGHLIDTGCFNPIGRFAGLINLCDVILTGDSLAVHVGLALGKRMIVLLGPTSEAEVDLYGQGKKIHAEMECLCCYRQTCHTHPNCMESVSVDTVFGAIMEEIGFSGTRSDESRRIESGP
jgi:ADP-heptose:LPS heptosyltransferase